MATFWSTNVESRFKEKQNTNPFSPWKYISKKDILSDPLWKTKKTLLTILQKHSNNWKSSHDHGEEVECHLASLKPWIPGRKVGVELDPGVVNLGLHGLAPRFFPMNQLLRWNLREKNLFCNMMILFLDTDQTFRNWNVNISPHVKDSTKWNHYII